MDIENKQDQSEKWPLRAEVAEGPEQDARDKETCTNSRLRAH